jgi:vacuolar-type H+-ATPase subunit C/Vma6
MFRSYRFAYAYAKIFGKIANSYMGDKLMELVKSRKTSELLKILLPDSGEGEEHRLTVEMEKMIIIRNIESIIDILDLIDDPDPVLLHLLQKYDYQNIKTICHHISLKRKVKPDLWDLGLYSLFHFFEDRPLNEQLEKSPFRWVLEDIKDKELYWIKNRIDREYYLKLWDLGARLSKIDKRGVMKLIKLEVDLQNVIWALRLRFYYSYEKEKAEKLLIPLPNKNRLDQILSLFDIPADEPAKWKSWNFSWLIEDQLKPDMEKIDPLKAEDHALLHLNKRFWKLFHQDPFTLTPFYCFIKLKEMEAGLLKTVLEGFRMNIQTPDIISLVSIL